MNPIFNLFATAFVLLSTSSAVFAQECVPAPYRMGQQQRCYDGRPIGGVVVPGQVVAVPANAIRVPVGRAVPHGYCSWGGRVENVAAGALIGGVIGLLAGDNHRAAGKGAAAGATVGLFIPCQQEALRQPVQYVPQAQQQFLERPQTQQSEHCTETGKKKGILNLPGHQKDGQVVCALPEDPNISRWIDGSPTTNPLEGVCRHTCRDGHVPVIAPDRSPQCRPAQFPPKEGEKQC